MSKAKGRNTDTPRLQRWMEILRLIPARSQATSTASITTTDLQKRLETQGIPVELRTLRNDLEQLSGIAPITREERHNGHLWFWPHHAPRLDLPTMGPEAALALLLARERFGDLLSESLRTALDSYFRTAEATLAGNTLGHLPTRLATRDSGLSLLTPEIRPEVMETVLKALQRRCQLEADYRSRSQGEQRRIRLHPQGIIQQDTVLYLVATAWDYQDTRNYALHRMDEATLLVDAPARLVDDDAFRDCIQRLDIIHEGEPLRLRLRLTTDAVYHLRERRLAGDQEICETADPDWCELTASVADTQKLRFWLWSFAQQVEVLEPAPLREEIGAALRTAAARY